MPTLFTPPPSLHIYTDGGCIGANPSHLGGTWAYVLVNECDGELLRQSGVVTPEQAGLLTITNNYTELFACVEALARMGPQWSGTLHTDSLVTKRRLCNAHAKMNGIPVTLRERLALAKSLLGAFTVVLLGGHPTKRELAAGCRASGVPVSKWNCLCDKLCCERSAEFMSRQAA